MGNFVSERAWTRVDYPLDLAARLNVKEALEPVRTERYHGKSGSFREQGQRILAHEE
jgi:hypothetical protein